MLYDVGDNGDLEALVVREEETGSGQSVWELNVYRLAHGLGVSAHRLSLQPPKYELYEVGSQLRRAAKLVSANLVEGCSRHRYKAEYLRFLVFAKASSWVRPKSPFGIHRIATLGSRRKQACC